MGSLFWGLRAAAAVCDAAIYGREPCVGGRVRPTCCLCAPLWRLDAGSLGRPSRLPRTFF
jgi:hypothetical protein